MSPTADEQATGPADVEVFPDAEAMSARAAERIIAAIGDARREREIAHVALSGGTTPVQTYALLAQHIQEWGALELWFADERCVPPDDAESNYRLVRETLPAAEHVNRMEGELGPARGAARYAEELLDRLPIASNSVPVLDLVVLGIGAEGHIASLFPNSTTLADPREDVFCVAVHGSPKPPPERISLGLTVLRAARGCLLLASGEGKAQALAAALGEPSVSAPASLLPRERLAVLADDAAASALSAR